MDKQAFIAWAEEEARRLLDYYLLTGWEVRVRVAPADAMRPDSAADVLIQEPYRLAYITFDAELVERGHKTLFLDILNHEVMHVHQHPFEALTRIVLDLLPENLQGPVGREFKRTSERMRADLERLLKERAPKVGAAKQLN